MTAAEKLNITNHFRKGEITLNSIILLGRVAVQPELRTTPAGKSVCEFRLAVPRYGNSEKADFLPIVAWQQTAEFICRNIVKGERILVHGELHTDQFTTQSGEKRTKYEVVVDRVEFADGKERKAAAPMTAREAIEEIVDDETSLPF